MTKRFPGLPEREKMDWSTNTAAFYKHILSKGCSELRFFELHIQDMRVFSYCKFTAVSEIVVRPPNQGWPGGSGRGWTQMCSLCSPHPLSLCRKQQCGSAGEITFQLYIRMSLHTWVFSLHDNFPVFCSSFSWIFGSVKYKNVFSTETTAI